MKKAIRLLILAFSITSVISDLTLNRSTSALTDTPWGPERTTFTWGNPAPYATFNSITNNPDLGDERDFVRIREVADDTIFGNEVQIEAGKTYEVYIYYHNNADAHDVGTTAIGIADGASVKSSLPATVKANERATVTGTIFASDTDPLSVWDGAYIDSMHDAYLRYVPGSATIHNGGELNGQSIDSDYLFGDGALLGYNTFSGLLPGCNEYAGYITYQFFVDIQDFTVEKTVVSGSTEVKPGDEVTFKIRYDNIGTMDQLGVVLRDTLPEGLTYVQGSTILYNDIFVDGKQVNDDLITENGINIGDYASGSGWAEVVYKATVDENVECNAELVNSAIANTTNGNKTALVTLISKPNNCIIPEESKKTEEPSIPDIIIDTGPVERILATIIMLGILGGSFYLYHTHRILKTVENEVSGKQPEKAKDKKPEKLEVAKVIDKPEKTQRDENQGLNQQ